MKILVCISNVPDTTSKITFTNNNSEFNNAGIQYIINPYDEIALSKAVDLVNGGANGTVTVINVGEASTEPTIRKALAIGADQAIRVNATPKDAWFVANQIAEYAKKNDFDLILTGRESIDYNGAQVPAMVGELLSIPSVSIAKKLTIENKEVTIEREIEGGKEVLTASFPVVVGTAEGVAEPKIPNMRGIMGARSKSLEVIEPIAVEALTSFSSYETPPTRGSVKLIEESNVHELVNLLHTEAKVI
ncbi:electron transfer flavoprotein subunit beta/FixA family protein [Sphingobacterium alkalisoli]|uniref:Electron transfer flavoprotein subunit beta n=1 Tax=Sphingobacterium alkalisoli TaxID=1874115 RepID=A0A4U0H4C1_9SPHI|nr:electron transfer flavoprotein subunit beta/FixA family protein [Sphingobacterium alkalisoli]TJY66510.1 electron transfer flavoprotein subunit beta/FixA family protein [Sphingobacterium alkalisoli]GGH15946.1 electron transfer flavoprotein subunit alpha [Sphingobacterium alkalisoli]